MSNPQQNLLIPGNRVELASEESPGVVKIAKDINSLTDPNAVPNVNVLQNQFGAGFTFGKGVQIINQGGTDLNDYRSPGLFLIPLDDIGKQTIGMPGFLKDNNFGNSHAGMLQVIRTSQEDTGSGGDSGILQRFYSYNSGVYYRFYQKPQQTFMWSPWMRIFDDQNLSSQVLFNDKMNILAPNTDGQGAKVNLDLVNKGGIYIIPWSEYATNGSNFPTGMAGTMMVIRTSDRNATHGVHSFRQMYYPHHSTLHFCRVFYSTENSWTKWETFSSDNTKHGNTNQKYTNVLSNRVNGTQYTNSTGAPITVYIEGPSNTSAIDSAFSMGGEVEGIRVAYRWVDRGVKEIPSFSFVVPPGQKYLVRAGWGNGEGASQAITKWIELR